MNVRPMHVRDQLVLDFIREYIEEAGYPPTQREIAKAVDAGSIATVRRALWSLMNKGLISVPPSSSRAIQIVDAP